MGALCVSRDQSNSVIRRVWDGEGGGRRREGIINQLHCVHVCVRECRFGLLEGWGGGGGGGAGIVYDCVSECVFSIKSIKHT